MSVEDGGRLMRDSEGVGEGEREAELLGEWGTVGVETAMAVRVESGL